MNFFSKFFFFYIDPDENGFNIFDTNELQYIDDTMKSIVSSTTASTSSSVECTPLKSKIFQSNDDEKCDSNSNIMYPQRESPIIVTTTTDNISAMMQQQANKKQQTPQQSTSSSISNNSENIRSKYKNISTCTVVLNSIDPIPRKILPGRKTAGPKSVIAALAAKTSTTTNNICTTTTTTNVDNLKKQLSTSFNVNNIKENMEYNQIESDDNDEDDNDNDDDDENGELFEFEEADVPHVPLYHLRDEGSVKWALLNDLCYLLKVKSKDTLLKQVSMNYN